MITCPLCTFVGYVGVRVISCNRIFFYKHLAISVTFQGKTAGILCVSFKGEVKVRH